MINFVTIFCRTIADVVTNLQTKGAKYPSFDMVVRRSNILTDALRRMERLSFNPEKELNV